MISSAESYDIKSYRPERFALKLNKVIVITRIIKGEVSFFFDRMQRVWMGLTDN